jgi:superfamily II DNA or RNA helicase
LLREIAIGHALVRALAKTALRQFWLRLSLVLTSIRSWTATPCRGDGRGLGGIFDALIESPQVAELVDIKFLVGTKVYAPTAPDLAGVRVQAGDWVESQLAERMDRPKLAGDIVEHGHRLAERRKTVVFASGVQHSLHIRDEFLKSEARAAHIDGATPKVERDAILRQLAQGSIDIVTN